MKRSIFFTMFLVCALHSFSQTRYFSKNTNISFYSSALLEDIEAHNNTSVCVVEAGTGKIELSVPVKGFVFSNSLMQEHFNENYLESDKFPKAAFRGVIASLGNTDLSKDGTYRLSLSGSLYMHGVSNIVNAEALFTVTKGVISASSEFIIKPADYNIKIPLLVRDKIAKTVRVVIDIPLLKKI